MLIEPQTASAKGRLLGGTTMIARTNLPSAPEEP
jgi:hypothetical protein